MLIWKRWLMGLCCQKVERLNMLIPIARRIYENSLSSSSITSYYCSTKKLADTLLLHMFLAHIFFISSWIYSHLFLTPEMVAMSIIIYKHKQLNQLHFQLFSIGCHNKHKLWHPPRQWIYISFISCLPDNCRATKRKKRRGGVEKRKDIQDTGPW